MGNREDAKLWEKVKATVKPLRPKHEDFADLVSRLDSKITRHEKAPAAAKVHKPAPQRASGMHGAFARSAAPLDPATARKIAKGRIAIEGRIDLHGMTQVEAHQNLWRFIEFSHRAGRRTVLVITGKGSRGEGILRRSVPLWLAEGEFRRFVSGNQPAHQAHGGSGAYYVRLKRPGRGTDR